MTNTTTASVAPFGAIAIFRTINTVETIFSALQMRRANNKNNKALRGLSSAQLADIGISRHGRNYCRNSRFD